MSGYREFGRGVGTEDGHKGWTERVTKTCKDRCTEFCVTVCWKGFVLGNRRVSVRELYRIPGLWSGCGRI